MTPFTRKLAVAAVLAAALPAAALAHDRDGDRDEDCDRAPPAAYVPPPAANAACSTRRWKATPRSTSGPLSPAKSSPRVWTTRPAFAKPVSRL